jgi:hypothetical protein
MRVRHVYRVINRFCSTWLAVMARRSSWREFPGTLQNSLIVCRKSRILADKNGAADGNACGIPPPPFGSRMHVFLCALVYYMHALGMRKNMHRNALASTATQHAESCIIAEQLRRFEFMQRTQCAARACALQCQCRPDCRRGRWELTAAT